MTTLSGELKKRRAITGETQAQVAKATGLDRGTIIRYESGASYPGVRQKKAIADWLGVQIEDLPPWSAPSEPVSVGKP